MKFKYLDQFLVGIIWIWLELYGRRAADLTNTIQRTVRWRLPVGLSVILKQPKLTVDFYYLIHLIYYSSLFALYQLFSVLFVYIKSSTSHPHSRLYRFL